MDNRRITGGTNTLLGGTGLTKLMSWIDGMKNPGGISTAAAPQGQALPASPLSPSSADRVAELRQAYDLPGRLAEHRQGQADAFNQRWQTHNMEAQYGGQNGYTSPLSSFEGRPGGIDPNMTPERQQYMQQTHGFRYGQGGAIGRGMLSRFGQGSPLTGPGTTADIASSGQPYMQVGGYGSPLTPLNYRPPNMGQQFNDMQAGMSSRMGLGGPKDEYEGPYVQTTPDGLAYTSKQQALLNLGDTRGAAAEQARLDANKAAVKSRRAALGLSTSPGERRAERIADRAKEMARREAISLRHRGVSPLSAIGQGMAPNLHTRTQSQQGALSGSSFKLPDGSQVPLVPKGSPLTPSNSSTAATAASSIVASSPFFATIGVAPYEDGAPPTAEDVMTGVFRYINDNPNADLGEPELASLHALSIQLASVPDAFTPTTGSSVERVKGLNELAEIPFGDSARRKAWWNRYRSSPHARRPTRDDMERAMNEAVPLAF